jgi:hypothetical protein
MHELTITHNPDAGLVTVAHRHGGAVEGEVTRPFRFRLGEADRDLLLWYMETYTAEPWPDDARSREAERLMERLGTELFRAVLGDPEAHALYEKLGPDLRAAGIVIDAPSPEGTALPWELLRDPDLDGVKELARRVGRFVRGRAAAAGRPDRPAEHLPPAAGEPLSILLVICRPKGGKDLPFLSVAQELHQLARDHPDRVRLDILRPRTFAALERRLSRRRYTIVHFDGHGEFREGGDARGTLLFEATGGGEDAVEGPRLGQCLAGHGVGAVVLNACRSGMTRSGSLNPSLGQELVAAGIPGVVAMAYEIHLDAAVAFTRRLYEGLLEGDPLAEAARQGRNTLWSNPTRQTPMGVPVRLGDWAVPVCLEDRPAGPFLVREAQAGEGFRPVEVGCDEVPAERLLGRDHTFLRIEDRIAEGSRVVVLAGGPGMGKTATAVEFARWYAPTCDPPYPAILRIDGLDGLFFDVAFVEAVGAAFGGELYGARDEQAFSELPFPAQYRAAVELLRKRGGILIIDGVGEAEDLGDADPGRELARTAIKAVSDRSTLVLVATRDERSWHDYTVVPLGKLAREDAHALLQRELLRHDSEYATLSAKLGGEGPLGQLIDRGCPRETIGAARGDVASGPEGASWHLPVVGPALAAVRRALEACLGDPVAPPPSDRAVRSSFDRVLAVCVLLLMICFVALWASYGVAGPQWVRMFTHIAHKREELAGGMAERSAFSSGFFVELFRAVIYVGLCLFWILGMVFRDETLRLIPYAPWRTDVGPRRLTVRSWFRAGFLVVALGLTTTTIEHHIDLGPKVLWRCNGNPFLEPYVYGDAEQMRQAIESLRESDRKDFRPEPGPSEYAQYEVQCLYPYLLYLPFSLVLFVMVMDGFLVLGLYALCSAAWTHAVLQTRRMDEFCKSSPSELQVRNRFLSCKDSMTVTLRKFSSFLVFLLFALWYGFWFDRYNITITAFAASWTALVVMMVVVAALVGVLWVAYGQMLDMAVRALPQGDRAEAFRRQNRAWTFFRRQTFGPGYFPVCLILAVTGVPLWSLVSWLCHWER